ncbi:MAG: hypothetical protein SFY66_19970 [Oculatellaceae cyanobacterium bins.114]|nr:hypothetical protein [Oculatellaceae cyanobacterium bins.114]
MNTDPVEPESEPQQPHQARERQDEFENILPKSNQSRRQRQNIDTLLSVVEKNPNLLESKKRNLHRSTMEAIWNKLDL